jgi:hypothetical protein
VEDKVEVSHVDIYHKLGKLEGLMEVICHSHQEFTQSVKDIHERIDSVEKRIAPIELKQSSNNGSVGILTLLSSMFVGPLLIGLILWHADKAWNPDHRPQPSSHQQIK